MYSLKNLNGSAGSLKKPAVELTQREEAIL